MGLPGLSEALKKLDATSDQMGTLITGIDRVVTLLEEQNELLRQAAGLEEASSG